LKEIKDSEKKPTEMLEYQAFVLNTESNIGRFWAGDFMPMVW
jgi:hypothetical protein